MFHVLPRRGTALALALCSLSVEAADRALQAPLNATNRNPFVQIHGLPQSDSAELAGEGKWRGRMSWEAANSFTVNDEGNEAIVLDGESYYGTLDWRYGLSERIELGLVLPYTSHQAGGLDSFIEDWHSFWGLPNGDREKFPQDRLLYQYRADGETVYRLDDNGDGIGDVRLKAAYQFSASEDRLWAARLTVKLPTGDEDALRGSDATDVAAALHVSDYGFADGRVALHGSVGALWLGDGKVLEEQQEDAVLFGSGGVNWAWTESFSLKLQVDWHTAHYDSELTELGEASAQLLMGGTIRLKESIYLDLAISEDIAVDTAPDVVFQLGLRVSEW